MNLGREHETEKSGVYIVLVLDWYTEQIVGYYAGTHARPGIG